MPQSPEQQRVLFDLRSLYYLPQFEPVARALERRGVEVSYVVYRDPTLGGLLEQVIARQGLQAEWVTSPEEAAGIYTRRRPDWVVFGHVFMPDAPMPPEVGRALVYHSVGPKSGRYQGGLKHMHVRFVESAHYEREIERRYHRRGELVVTGFAKLDPLFASRPSAEQRAAGLTALGLDPEAPTVLYAPTYFPSSIECLPRDLPARLEGLNLLVKPHFLSLARGRYRGQRRRLRAWARHPRVHVTAVTDYSLLPFMSLADAMVSEGSSALFEFCALDRPIVICDFFKLRLGYRGIFRHRLARRLDESTDAYRDVGPHARTPQELPDLLRAHLANPDDFREARARCARELVGATDGRASERIAEWLTTHSSPGTPLPLP